MVRFGLVRAATQAQEGALEQAHADQDGLVDWYAAFEGRPPLYLVHGEERSQGPLAARLRSQLDAPVSIAGIGQTVDIG